MSQDTSDQHETPSRCPTRIRLLSFNCWGLKYISKYRHERLREIGAQIASSDPPPDIVGLQECWTQQDYQSIHEQTKHLLPHAKYYYSGIFGGGLAILSRWPIEESTMFRYPLNGRPTAFWRGDWYVGKGVACARIRIGPSKDDVVRVFNTHLHAPYTGPNTSGAYLEHRIAQAWEISKLLRDASESGHLVIGLGDFNIVPRSLAYRIICTHGGVQDIWRVLHPDSAIAPAKNRQEQKRREDGGKEVPTALFNITKNGTTCDSPLNTWRWTSSMRKQLHKTDEMDEETMNDIPDVKGKRLDYIFLGSTGVESKTKWRWKVDEAKVGMTARHPTLRCSLSDHFSVEATISCEAIAASANEDSKSCSYLPPTAYNKILGLIDSYTARSCRQRHFRLAHFGLSLTVSLACIIGVLWSPHNYISFILLLVSTFGFSIGVVDGLIGGLFFSQEIRALKEWKWEIINAKKAAMNRKEATEAEEVPDSDDWVDNQ